MNDIISYIDEYAGKSFKELAFNDVDNLIFSQLVYTDFEGIISKNSSMSIKDTAKMFNALHPNDEIENLIGISTKSAHLLDACAKAKRYKNVRITRYINNVSGEIDKQFSAVCFELNEHDIVVAFRGTDVTVTGLKESVMISCMFPVPAQIEALFYFQETAMRYDGEIRILGHSKGGNLAVFAGVNCSNSLKKRIVQIYEDDAPGFPAWFFDRYDYKEIKDRIRLITPDGSMIGRMLLHDVTPIIVQSTNTGLKQHQVSSWVVDGCELKTAEKYNLLSDVISDYVNQMIDYVGEDDLEVFFNFLEHIAESCGVENFYDLKHIDLKTILSLIDNISTTDEALKEQFRKITKKAFSTFTKEFISEKANHYLKKDNI